ncbi:MAG TPA: CBS domain-containing protein [Polyangia bacterium]|nr:CBS domain-containing protein [Polyangia bacterium]
MGADDLTLRVRRVATGSGEVYTDLSVHCPRQDRSVPLAECERCQRCGGVHWDAEARRSVVRCDSSRAAATAGRTPVSSVMSGDVICVTADYSIEAITALLVERNFSGAPVVDAEGRAIGVVSKTDLLRDQLAPGVETVGDVMMPLAFTLPESAPLSQAAALMVKEGVHRLPIVSAEGRVVGLLTAFDVMRWLARESGS